MGNLKASVSMITFNHEKFIAQAIESIMSQQTSFEFELVIGDDGSTNNTRAICEQYQKQFGNKIRLIFNDKNIGSVNNFLQNIYSCDGDFIAICDGDDFWTDNSKLQKQVSFLDSHKDYSFCFTNVRSVDANGKQIKPFTQIYYNDTFTHESYVAKITPPTVTTLFRKNMLPKVFPDEFKVLPNTDMFLKALLSEKGKVHFENSVTASYRINNAGVYSGLNSFKKLEDKIKAYNLMFSYFKNNTVRKNILDAIASTNIKLLLIAAKKLEPIKFLKYSSHIIKDSFSTGRLPFSTIKQTIKEKQQKREIINNTSKNN